MQSTGNVRERVVWEHRSEEEHNVYKNMDQWTNRSFGRSVMHLFIVWPLARIEGGGAGTLKCFVVDPRNRDILNLFMDPITCHLRESSSSGCRSRCPQCPSVHVVVVVLGCCRLNGSGLGGILGTKWDYLECFITVIITVVGHIFPLRVASITLLIGRNLSQSFNPDTITSAIQASIQPDKKSFGIFKEVEVFSWRLGNVEILK